MNATPSLTAAKRGREPSGVRAGSTFGTPGDINLLGLWMLYWREVRRFLKVPAQTCVAPVVTTLMFLAIFTLALGGGERRVEGLPFLVFLAPGLAMMAVIQNSFANTISSLVIAKVQGNIVDLLMPPLGPGELVTGLTLGGVTRGLIVGVSVGLAVMFFVTLPMPHPFLAIAFLLLSSGVLALLGLIGGLWAEKFDQTATVTNFVVTPLSFLSGTFYSVEQLPEAARWIAHANPIFYMIDGFRFACIGHADGSVLLGFMLLLALNAMLARLAYVLVKRGYRLKS
jgi:ABC-2 type transport system permease protein